MKLFPYLSHTPSNSAQHSNSPRALHAQNSRNTPVFQHPPATSPAHSHSPSPSPSRTHCFSSRAKTKKTSGLSVLSISLSTLRNSVGLPGHTPTLYTLTLGNLVLVALAGVENFQHLRTMKGWSQIFRAKKKTRISHQNPPKNRRNTTKNPKNGKAVKMVRKMSWKMAP